MGVSFRVGDVFERLAEVPDGSVDLVVTSPPFLALRSYLPADHVHKHREIGSESTPAGFLDTLLELSAELGRVLAPHGSLCVELGDTYSGSGGAGGDYATGGMREGQGKFDGSARRTRESGWHRSGKEASDRYRSEGAAFTAPNGGPGWPLAKSLTGIPTLYPWSLAYGRNLLTGIESPAGLWRIRNVIVWGRPNPPVGALGDKFRPATSYITVACRGAKRYFDLDAVRTEHQPRWFTSDKPAQETGARRDDNAVFVHQGHPAGAPPLDWHDDMPVEDGDWLWKLSTQPYAGSHYATFPLTLPRRLIEAMCPLRVCITCGKPSERITAVEYEPHGTKNPNEPRLVGADAMVNGSAQGMTHGRATKNVETVGWSDCGHDTWRTGRVLDPFAGSGTTLEAAQLVGRHAIGIDLDERNAWLARDRVGMFLEVDEGVSNGS